MVAVVQVAGVSWEPWSFHGDALLADQSDVFQGRGLPQVLDELEERLTGHLYFDEDVQVVLIGLVWSGFEVFYGTLVFLYGLQYSSKGAHAFT